MSVPEKLIPVYEFQFWPATLCFDLKISKIFFGLQLAPRLKIGTLDSKAVFQHALSRRLVLPFILLFQYNRLN